MVARIRGAEDDEALQRGYLEELAQTSLDDGAQIRELRDAFRNRRSEIERGLPPGGESSTDTTASGEPQRADWSWGKWVALLFGVLYVLALVAKLLQNG